MDSTGRKAAVAVASAGLAYLAWRKLRSSAAQRTSSPPVSGNALVNFFRLLRAGNMTRLFAQQQKQLGDIFLLWIPPIFPRACVVMDIESVHAVTALESKLHMGISMPPSYEALHGTDLQLLNGEAHKLWRRILNPVISPRALDSYAPRLLAAFQEMWRGLAERGGECVIRDAVRRTQLRAMADILFGAVFEDESAFDRLDDDFETECAGLFAPPINLPGTTFRKALQAAGRIRTYLTDLLQKEVQRRAAAGGGAAGEGAGCQKPLRSAMEAIVELYTSPDERIRETMANEELVVNNLLLLLEASQGTTMLATTSLIAELHREGHEGVLAKARAEVLAFARGEEGAGELTVQALEKLEYCNACINEVLRLYPFAGSIPKFLPEGQTLEVGGKVVHGPLDVFLSFGQALEDPGVFPRPLDFLPERWLPGAAPELAASEAARRAFLPFGLGTHICLGYSIARLSMKVTLLALFAGGYEVRVAGPLERVPDVLPSYRIANGGVARVARAAGA
mmetsp:Transcript_118570/g.382801  ORF Transcript_118570/g.382801 Transcript_118570/m.382801 type:complete len:509 (+) Transcript_118570:93-1619(+)